MLSDRPFTGLVPEHLGFRAPRRRTSVSAENSPREMNAPLPQPAPVAPAASPVPESAIANSPPVILSPRVERDVSLAASPPGPPSPRLGGHVSKPAKTLAAPGDPAPPLRGGRKEGAATPSAMHSAERAAWRHACDWLELHRLCRHRRCRHAGRCRGEPVSCLHAGVPRVPRSARYFVTSMMRAQDLGLPFEEAFENAADYFDSYEAWVIGLEAGWRGE